MDRRCWRNTEQVLTVQSRCCLGQVGICSEEQRGELLREPKYATKMFLEITGRFCNFQKPENWLQVTKTITGLKLNANVVSALAPSLEKPPYHEREVKEGANTQAEVQKKKDQRPMHVIDFWYLQ
ncbi:hypothetical protein E5288_WYG008086 [Bos mutus]|uniref:Uncharacterized protein n=1 Tax=Bos mutus TaxID=72004 RepID=A0A6B0RYV5_9CETA|nr:hypothetical protein [Bos mutus]